MPSSTKRLLKHKRGPERVKQDLLFRIGLFLAVGLVSSATVSNEFVCENNN